MLLELVCILLPIAVTSVVTINKYLFKLDLISSQLNIPFVATNDVHYLEPARSYRI